MWCEIEYKHSILNYIQKNEIKIDLTLTSIPRCASKSLTKSMLPLAIAIWRAVALIYYNKTELNIMTKNSIQIFQLKLHWNLHVEILLKKIISNSIQKWRMKWNEKSWFKTPLKYILGNRIQTFKNIELHSKKMLFKTI